MKEKHYHSYEDYWKAVEDCSMRRDNVSLNNGNRKTGKACLTLSLPPLISCRNDCPCASVCYARKGRMVYAQVQGSYLRNYRIWQEDPVKFEKQFDAALTYNALPLLRVCDSGDLIDKEFFEMLVRVIGNHPEIKAMAFTKKYEIVNETLEHTELPENFCVRFSMWDKNWAVPNPHDLPVAYVDFKDSSLNPEIPQNAFVCRGGKDGITCSNCRMCFNKNVRAIRLLQH